MSEPEKMVSRLMVIYLARPNQGLLTPDSMRDLPWRVWAMAGIDSTPAAMAMAMVA
ncbi:MAG: hypothetical protein OXH47_09795 [Paracoccaceae bacterium]|nr:hypothetical protein [Paracoccaceae bacterium]